MHCKMFLTQVVRSLALGLTVGLTLTSTGCKMGSWSSPSWMAWGKKDAPSTAGIASTKPSTSLPSSTATPKPTTSVAVSTPGSTTTTPSTTATASNTATPAYPTTSQAYAYPTQPASGYQPTGGGEVAPAAGYSAGPYAMSSGQNVGAQQSPYAPSYQGGYGAAPAAAEAPAPQAQTWNSTPTYTADQRSAYGAAEQSPYSSPAYGAAPQYTTPINNPPAAPATGYNQGGYSSGGYDNSGYAPAAPAPGNHGQPQYQPAPGGYETQPTESAPPAYPNTAPAGAAPPSYGASNNAQPSASPGGYQPALPPALASDPNGGYRPGSTGRSLNEGSSTVTASGSASYGNVYR